MQRNLSNVNKVVYLILDKEESTGIIGNRRFHPHRPHPQIYPLSPFSRAQICSETESCSGFLPPLSVCGICQTHFSLLICCQGFS